MGDKTKIEWTEATWNPVTGCTKVSAGCKYCYAERDWARLQHLPAYKGRAFTDVVCHPERLIQPLRWERPRRIFVNSMSDLFHDDAPDEFLDQVFAVMALCQQHTFQVLTKRARRAREYIGAGGRASAVLDLVRNSELGYMANQHALPPQSWPLPNVWLGVSVEDQQTADERIPLLLQTPAAVRWISAEPLIGRIDLCESLWMWWNPTMECFESIGQRFNMGLGKGGLGWVVVGGESGPKARPMHPDWARSIRDKCAAAGVPFFFKQWGEWIGADQKQCPVGPPAGRWMWSDGTPWSRHDTSKDGNGSVLMCRAGKRAAGRLLDGVLHDEYPI